MVKWFILKSASHSLPKTVCDAKSSSSCAPERVYCYIYVCFVTAFEAPSKLNKIINHQMKRFSFDIVFSVLVPLWRQKQEMYAMLLVFTNTTNCVNVCSMIITTGVQFISLYNDVL